MNFIWDIALRAKQEGKQEKDLFFLQAKDKSPHYEQAFSVLNQKTVETKEIEINALYRFSGIVQELLHRRITEAAEFEKYLFDCIMHILLYIDLHHGVTKRDLFLQVVMREVLEGTFGEEAANSYRQMESTIQNRLATLILAQLETGSSLVLFRKAILVLYKGAILYQVKTEKKKLLLYIDQKRTEKQEQKVNFIIDMFLPLNYEIRVFWHYHFGVIGIEDTMKINQIKIY